VGRIRKGFRITGLEVRKFGYGYIAEVVEREVRRHDSGRCPTFCGKAAEGFVEAVLLRGRGELRRKSFKQVVQLNRTRSQPVLGVASIAYWLGKPIALC